MGKRKYNYEAVKNIFEDRGCQLLSTEYQNPKQKLKYRCECGEVSEIAFEKFNSGQLCGKCRFKRGADKRRHSYAYVKQVFEANGCQLLSDDYVNGKQKLRYICECGFESEISFNKFKIGQRCSECKVRKIREKLSGTNSPNWRFDIPKEERIRDRQYPEYKEWRRKVYERDKYTCQRCGDRGGTLNAHHIESYSKKPDKRLDINNGITLCKDCHKQYHRDFYKNDADEETFRIYILGDYNEPPCAGEVDEVAYTEYLEGICN